MRFEVNKIDPFSRRFHTGCLLTGGKKIWRKFWGTDRVDKLIFITVTKNYTKLFKKQMFQSGSSESPNLDFLNFSREFSWNSISLRLW